MWYRFSKKKYDSAIIALWFKPKDIENLQIKHKLTKRDLTYRNEFHVTLMYIGDLSEIEPKKDVIEKCLENLALKYNIFNLKIGGVAKFFTDDVKNPYVFTVNAPEIELIRNDLLSIMGGIGIEEPEDSPPFTPHMTFGFLDKKEDIDSVSVKNDQLEVDGLCLSWGGDLKYFKFK